MEIKIGDKFKGKVNGAIFEVIDINKKDGLITYKAEDKNHIYGLEAFKKYLIEKVNN